jgi:hypothetical protein
MHSHQPHATETPRTASSLLTSLVRGQAILYLVTGLWPVIHMPSFEFVTGPKRDDWLVKTVGALLAVIGFGLWRGRQRVSQQPELPLLAVGTAGTLATVDIVYYWRGVLRWVYLVDAAVELVLVAGWLTTLLQRRRHQR